MELQIEKLPSVVNMLVNSENIKLVITVVDSSYLFKFYSMFFLKQHFQSSKLHIPTLSAFCLSVSKNHPSSNFCVSVCFLRKDPD